MVSVESKKEAFIGQRYANVDGLAKVTGKLQYSADVHVPGALCGKVLRSPYAHAIIKKIDCSKASKLPGVKAIVTGDDFPALGRREFFTLSPVAVGKVFTVTLAERLARGLSLPRWYSTSLKWKSMEKPLVARPSTSMGRS